MGATDAATVTLTAKDANGNLITTGGATVVFGLGTGTASGLFSGIVDNGDGTYTATFTGSTAGTNTITATVNGNAVTTTAPTIVVTPSLSQSAVSVNPSGVPSGDTTSVTFTARDSAGNQLTTGGLNVVFSLVSPHGGDGTFSSVTDNGDGTYTATFTGASIGANSITATVEGIAITSTPADITITPSLSQSTVSVSPSSVVHGVADAATVTVVARDASGNQATSGGEHVTLALGTGSGDGTFSAVTDNGDGTYTATFTGTIPGTNTIVASIDSQNLTSTAPTITIT
jgi:adhesin/invasin